MNALVISGLTKRYGPVTALAGVDLEVRSGSRTAIVGPSGCGKTTLLRLVAGFEAPDGGRIMLDGNAMAGETGFVPAHRRGIGVVAQDGALFPHLSIADNIGFGLGRGESGREARITELAYIVGLDKGILKRRPHELSGGQQQRVALARAMAVKPRLMLLDEPFSALDTGLRASMRKAVAELLEGAGITTVLVTHDQAEVMRDGTFSQVGSPRDLYMKPKDRMVAEFLGDAIVLAARIIDGHAECRLGRIPVEGPAHKESARIMLRPEQITVKRTARQGMSGSSDMLFGEVSECEFAGAVCTIAVRLLNNPDPPDAAAIGSTPLLLKHSGIDAPSVGEIVRIAVTGKAHMLG